jgi:AbiU2
MPQSYMQRYFTKLASAVGSANHAYTIGQVIGKHGHQYDGRRSKQAAAFIRRLLLEKAALSVSKTFDPRHKKYRTASLDGLAQYIEKSHNRIKIMNREKALSFIAEEETGQSRSRLNRRIAKVIVSKLTSARVSEPLKRLRFLRDKDLAHMELVTPKKGDLPRWNDVILLLGVTRQIITHLDPVYAGLGFSYRRTGSSTLHGSAKALLIPRPKK